MTFPKMWSTLYNQTIHLNNKTMRTNMISVNVSNNLEELSHYHREYV